MSDLFDHSKIADRVLEVLFVVGNPPPSKQALREAYPFPTTDYLPFKVWHQRIQAWRAAHALGAKRPIVKPTRPAKPVTEQDIASLFDYGDRG